VASVALASFFSDSGHEIATALLPSLVVSTLHSSAGALGLIEGSADRLRAALLDAPEPTANTSLWHAQPSIRQTASPRNGVLHAPLLISD
jgi:hypothetical protein